MGDRPIRVLRAVPRLPPMMGGQEIHVAELSRNLSAQGVEQTLLFSEGNPDLPGIKLVRVSTPRWRSGIAHDSVFGARLLDAAGEGPYDLVHTHGDAPVARGGAWAARRWGAVHVHTFHAGLASGLRGLILRALLPSESWYLAVSRQVARSIVRAGAAPTRVFIRPSGVRDDFFRAPGLQPRSGVAMGGRLIPEKGVLDFVKAWSDAGINETELSVFGAGSEASAIAALAARRPGFRWLGELGGAQVADLFLRTSVGVMMSLRNVQSSEGTPTIALEMLAAGCFPIVDRGAGEAPGLIERLGFGTVVDEPPNPRWVASLAREWSDARHDAARIATRQTVEKEYSWPAVATMMAEFYRRVTEEIERAPG